MGEFCENVVLQLCWEDFLNFCVFFQIGQEVVKGPANMAAGYNPKVLLKCEGDWGNDSI